jgi:hypothetical protein
MAIQRSGTVVSERREVYRLYLSGESGRQRLEIEPSGALPLPTAQRGVLDAVDRILALLVGDPSRGILLRRLLDEVPTLVEGLDAADVAEASGARDGRAALSAALRSALAKAEPPADPIEAAALGGAELLAALLEQEGGTWDTALVMQHLGLTRQAIHQRERLHRLLSVPARNGRRRYPAWQFAEAGVLPGFAEVSAALATLGVDVNGQVLFFLSDQDDIRGRRPLDALRAGDVAGVLSAARRFGDHSAS